MISISALSKKMNLTNRRIEQLLFNLKDYCSIDKMRPKRGKIDELEFLLAYVKYIEEKHRNAKSKQSELEKAQIRLRLAQAQNAEMEFEKNNQLLVPKEISINFIANIFGNIRNKLLGSPNRIAFQVFGSKTLTECKLKVTKIINEILSELSDPKNLYKKRN